MVRETGISNNINRINKKLYTAFNLLTIRAHLFGDSETKTSTVVLVLVFSVHLSSDIIHSKNPLCYK